MTDPTEKSLGDELVLPKNVKWVKAEELPVTEETPEEQEVVPLPDDMFLM